MPIIIPMPRLSDTMEEGTLVKWNVAVGDTVSASDHLADVETDKATMELNTFDDGTVAKLLVGEGDTVPIETPIVVLAAEGESIEEAAAAAPEAVAPAPKPQAPAEPEPQASSAPVASDESGTASSGANNSTQKVSPLARRLAEEHGLDLGHITGTGPGGRIIKRDILQAVESGGASATAPAQAAAAPAPVASAPAVPSLGALALTSKTQAVNGMRKTIAKRLVESKVTVPHFYLSTAVNMDPLMELRSTLNAQLATQGIKLSVNDFVTRAVALAAVQHPVMNASWTGDAIQYHGTVNVGTAIALPEERGGGLVVAVTKDVQNKGLRQISGEIKTLAKKARDRGLAPDEMSDSTITISNLGMPQYGITQFGAIVNPPNAAIIAIGAAIKKPVVKTVDGQDQIVIGQEMQVTLSGDHRVIDGATAAEYLASLRQMLEQPASLMV